MIKQFNHIAFFVASMILLRDKPKHRARCLEKFMSIAVVRICRYASLKYMIWWLMILLETTPPK
jgi:hypothetical protein